MGDSNILTSLKQLIHQDKGITVIRTEKEENIKYSELWNRSWQICMELKKYGAVKGSEILINCKELEYQIYSFWACVMGGFIAVPMDISMNQHKDLILKQVLKKLDDPFWIHDLSDAMIMDLLPPDKSLNINKFQFVETDAIEVGPNLDQIESNDIVCIQFSSGSTGAPRGVALRHYNLMANINSVIEQYGIQEDDIILTWQPLTHCYGLTTYHLLSIVKGVKQYLIPTDIFMKRPLLWMDKVNEHRATRIGAIPFGLRHFINFYQNSTANHNWDLSCVRSMSVGGEQVNAKLCHDFANSLKDKGFAETVILPAYGLAEATTMVSTRKLGDRLHQAYSISNSELEVGENINYLLTESTDGVSFLEVGTALSSINIRIVDAEGNTLPSWTLGYITVSGDSVSQGYYNDPEATQSLFDKEGWLNTGDMGFMAEDHLVIVGREKELVVSNGKKYSCINIENIINRAVASKAKGTVAVGNGMNGENNSELVLVFISEIELEQNMTIDEFINLANEVKKVVYNSAGIIVDEVIPVESIPKTFSGKLKRRALTNLYNQNFYNNVLKKIKNYSKPDYLNSGENNKKHSRSEVESIVIESLDQLFDIKVTDKNLTFLEYGIISINIPVLIEDLEKKFGIKIETTSIFNYPSILQFTEYIWKNIDRHEGENKVMSEKNKNQTDSDAIAIIGMSCRFPGGSNNLDDYWETLISGKDCVIDIPEDRWDVERYYNPDVSVSGKMYCKKTGFLNTPIDEFDARFFNMSPKEALATDPQQRLLLELTWEAFENACIDITEYQGSNTGVYLGISSNEYVQAHLNSGDANQIDAYSLTGINFSTACGRISYTFGFEGPSFAVDTACSSSLTALHLACMAIKHGEINTAVVAGVNLIISPMNSIGFTKLQATSPDGHSKSFDANADGYGRGEGGGVILVKKLSDALRDGDQILGVVRATGINQDGKSNGLTAPNGVSQANLMKQVLKTSNLVSTDIEYIEMHGTGTKLGDPIEVNAVAEVYGQNRNKNNPLMIGAVKSNIGHLEPASGIASIIKVLLSMKYDIIPANLNFNTPNPFINWDEIPIKVVDTHYTWKRHDRKRRAAISGFGFGGSNAHVILEEYKENTKQLTNDGEGINYVLKISAKGKNSLKKSVYNYVKLLERCSDEEFGDIIYSANRGRANFEYRLAVQGNSREDIIFKLKGFITGADPDHVFSNIDNKTIFKKDRKVVFMFTGQGSQYVNMGKDLFKTEPVFQTAIYECDKLFKPYILKSIVDLMYNSDATVIEKTVYAQPLIFSIEYALAKMWERFGIVPEIVMGHSIGEYAAAVVAGIMSVNDAVKLVSIRGRLMDSAPGTGSMGTIFAEQKTVEKLIEVYKSSVSIAAHNARESCVISGDSSDVEKVLLAAEEKGIRIRRLKVSHGFHSNLMEPVLKDFQEIAQNVTYHKANVRFVSSLSAKEIEIDEVLGAEYWTSHIREKVDFYHALLGIDRKENYAYLEVGASRVLSALCKLTLDEDAIVAASLNVKRDDKEQVSDTIALLYGSGVDINWKQVDFMGKKNWVKKKLPNYSFEKASYWKPLNYDKGTSASLLDSQIHPLLGQRIESPLMKNTIIFQQKFTAKKPFFMTEHIIFNTAISPAAAHISMVLSAIKEIKNPVSCMLKDIELRVPLAVAEDEERFVQFCFEMVDDNAMKFQIVSKATDDSDKTWLLHAKGEVYTSDEVFENNKKVDVKIFETRKEDGIKPEDGVYNLMMNSGFKLGKSFKRIMKSSCENGEFFCFIQPGVDIPEKEIYEIYPGVVDSILQSQFCAGLDELHNKYGEKRKQTVIPYYIGKFNYNYRFSDDLWVHGNLKFGDGAIYSNYRVYNTDGDVIIGLDDLVGNITGENDLLKEVKNSNSNYYYHIDWSNDLKNKMESLRTGDIKYILITDVQDNAELISKNFDAQNIKMQVWMHSVDGIEQQTSSLNQIDVTNRQSIHTFLESLTLEGNEDIEIIFAVGMNMKNDLKDYSVTPLKGLLYLIKEVQRVNMDRKIKIKVLTKNVQERENVGDINLLQAPLWGLSKVLSIEAPTIYGGIIDTDQDSLGSEALVEELMRTECNEVKLVNGVRYISRLKKHGKQLSNTKEKMPAVKVKEQSSYIITGGTGAVGMIYAEKLIMQGAKYLILICRKNPSKEVQRKIDQWKENGINIQLVMADICHSEELNREIDNVLKQMPDVRGVVHAAGVLKDGLIMDQEWDDFSSVLNPKIVGTINIYQILEKQPLEFFIMLSSMTSVVGNMGQGNYASANYFLNIFANYLQAKGISSYAMCWGPWQSSGMAISNASIDKNLSNMGIRPIHPETGGRIIEQFFERPFKNIMIADIDWEKMDKNSEGDWQKMFLTELSSEFIRNDTSENKEESLIDDLIQLEQTERKELLLNILSNKFAKIMGYGAGDVPLGNVGLREQGADSLMIFSMRSTVNKLLSIDIDVSAFFNYPTLLDLVDYLLENFLNPQPIVEKENADDFESTDKILAELENLIS